MKSGSAFFRLSYGAVHNDRCSKLTYDVIYKMRVSNILRCASTD